MRFLKGLFAFFLIIIIVGGIGFIGYNIYMGNLFGGMNMSADTTQNTSQNTTQNASDSSNMNMSGMNSTTTEGNQNVATPNPYDAQNREKIGEAIDLINKALELITIDPYSDATVPEDPMQMNNSQGQTSQSTGTINIYPSDNSSVSIVPDSNTANETESTMNNMDMDTADTTGSINHVYDQAKLQQLHSGIYTIALGVQAINELNDNLLTQSMTLEQQPYTYQTYVNRYNKALLNQSNLKKAILLLDNASVLINVNPYASDSGYSYDSGSMKQLHEGIYKFAQGMGVLESLNNDFVEQMSTASMSTQNLVYGMSTMDMSSDGLNLFGNISLSSIFNIIIMVLIVGVIVGVLGSILNMFKHKPQANS